MPSNHLILCYPFSSCLQSFPASRSFKNKISSICKYVFCVQSIIFCFFVTLQLKLFKVSNHPLDDHPLDFFLTLCFGITTMQCAQGLNSGLYNYSPWPHTLGSKASPACLYLWGDDQRERSKTPWLCRHLICLTFWLPGCCVPDIFYVFWCIEELTCFLSDKKENSHLPCILSSPQSRLSQQPLGRERAGGSQREESGKEEVASGYKQLPQWLLHCSFQTNPVFRWIYKLTTYGVNSLASWHMSIFSYSICTK